jgi:polyhydroxyalkanoate synthesis regulator phasin
MGKEQDTGDEGDRRALRVDAVRNAVDQAFSATAGQGAAAAESGRERAQDIVDQLAHAAGRVRGVIDELRPPTGDDLRALSETVAELERRVAALESAKTEARPTTRPAEKRS